MHASPLSPGRGAHLRAQARPDSMGRAPKIRLSWRPVSEHTVSSLGVVKLHISLQLLREIAPVGVFFEIDLFLLERPPESFDKNIVEEPTAPVHADADLPRMEQSQPFVARELPSLIGIENLWAPDKKCFA